MIILIQLLREWFEKKNRNPPAVVSYTATRWTYFLRRPKVWDKNRLVPDTGQCYRFVLSNPNVNICLTAPRNEKELEQNIKAVKEGPMSDEEIKLMKEYEKT